MKVHRAACARHSRGCASAGEGERRLGGGGREDETRREVMAELEEALLGGLPGGVDGVKATSAAAGAAQDVGAKGVLVKGGPVEAAGGLARLRLSLR